MSTNANARIYGPAKFACLAAAMLAISLAATNLLAGGPADKPGVVSHLNVVSDKSEDVSTLEAWKKTYIKEGMTDQEKAMAIWRTVVRYRTQTDPPDEFFGSEQNVHDPMKTIHVYGYGMCCCSSSNVDGLARYLGMKATCRGIGHMISEIWYDGGWHMVDGSLQQVFTKPDGKIAGAEDIRQAVTAWLDKHPEFRGADNKADPAKLDPFRQNDGWKKNGPELLATCKYFDVNGSGLGTHSWTSTMWYYDRKDVPEYETFPSMGYQLNVQLRDGEKITRNWFAGKSNIGGGDPVVFGATRPPNLTLQAQFGDKAPARAGSGEMTYDVPLATGAFRAGALQADNLATSTEEAGKPAVHVKDAAQAATLVIRFPSSYVYVSGCKADIDAVIGTGGGITVSFSDNNGLDWKPLDKGALASGKQTVAYDLLAFRKYDYQLKFELKGEGTGINSLKVTNPFQCSQAPLPTITEGENTVNFNAGPDEGTVTIEGNTLANANWQWKQLTYLNFHPVLNNVDKTLMRVKNGHGDATYKLTTPGDITRLRINLGYRARDKADYWQVSASFDGGKTFTDVDKVTGPTAGMTKYMTFDKVPAGSKEALVRFSGKEVSATCAFGLRIDADYKEPAGGFRPVKITYAWDDAGQLKTDEHVCTKAQDTYKITCGPKAVVKSMTMELAK